MGLRKSSLANSRGQFLVGICLTTALVCEGQDMNWEISWGLQVGKSDQSLIVIVAGPRVPPP